MPGTTELQAKPGLSPALAAVLGLLLGGVGHIYLGQRNRGIWITLLACVTCGVLNPVWAWDAWVLARKRQDEPIGSWENSALLRILDAFGAS